LVRHHDRAQSLRRDLGRAEEGPAAELGEAPVIAPPDAEARSPELTADEQQLLLQLIQAAGEPIDQGEIARLWDWAEEIQIDYATLQLVRAGRVSVRWLEGDDEPRFFRVAPA
jgi:hypothetical protein